MTDKKRNIRTDEQGVAFVELAVVLPLLFVIVFGGVEFARALHRYHINNNISYYAMRLGVRIAGLEDGTCTSTLSGGTLNMCSMPLQRFMHQRALVLLNEQYQDLDLDTVVLTSEYDSVTGDVSFRIDAEFDSIVSEPMVPTINIRASANGEVLVPVGLGPSPLIAAQDSDFGGSPPCFGGHISGPCTL